MGYANKSISERRVIQVWNTAFEGATIEKLPFDMRGRRGPISFNLPIGADTATLRTVRDKLSNDLAAHLKLALNQLPPPPAEALRWQAHFLGSQDVWFDPSEPQTVNNPMHGSSKVRWKRHFPGYARIIPSNWVPKPGAKQALATNSGHPAILARPNSLGFGISRGGTMVYWPGTPEDGEYPTLALTQWFERTGEFWGVGGGFLFQREGDRLTLATGYFYERWLDFLERNCALALAHGGSLPIHVRLGVNDLRNSWWPREWHQFDDEGYAAVEDSYEFDATLTSIRPDALQKVAVDAFNGLAAVYGIDTHSHDRIIKLSR